MKHILLFLLSIFTITAFSQHTFSIVAVDSVTGEIGSAGATCGDSIIWPGTPGAYIISDIIPGTGAIHTQALWDPANQSNANMRMQNGDSPQQIVDWLESNDVYFNPTVRQYGIVDYNNGSPRSAAYTGPNCFDYKNHIIGPNYAIQGNILLSQQILDSMEVRFNNTSGDLADKLMAAMQGAKVIGADTRCMTEGTSALSAFIRVACANDHPDSLWLDINVAGTAQGVEPIDVLQMKYDDWKAQGKTPCTAPSGTNIVLNQHQIELYPNPIEDSFTITNLPAGKLHVEIIDVSGKIVRTLIIHYLVDSATINTSGLSSGIYMVCIYSDTFTLLHSKKIVQK